MKNILLSACLVILTISVLQAQGPFPDPCACNEDEENMCPSDTCPIASDGCCVPVAQSNVPINGDLSWLIVGGILIGLFHFRKKYSGT